MKKTLAAICILATGLAYGEIDQFSSSTNRKKVLSCQGHEMTERIMGRFETAKNSKEKWDERTPYDSSIKACKSKMYKEDSWWVIEYSWTHVDDCPTCSNQITMEVPVE